MITEQIHFSTNIEARVSNLLIWLFFPIEALNSTPHYCESFTVLASYTTKCNNWGKKDRIEQ